MNHICKFIVKHSNQIFSQNYALINGKTNIFVFISQKKRVYHRNKHIVLNIPLSIILKMTYGFVRNCGQWVGQFYDAHLSSCFFNRINLKNK